MRTQSMIAALKQASCCSIDYMGNVGANDPWSNRVLQVGYHVNYVSILQHFTGTNTDQLQAMRCSQLIFQDSFNRGLTSLNTPGMSPNHCSFGNLQMLPMYQRKQDFSSETKYIKKKSHTNAKGRLSSLHTLQLSCIKCFRGRVLGNNGVSH